MAIEIRYVGNKNIGTWTALDTMGSDGGLYANYGSTQTLLY
jgi:hypothetical protein